MRFSKTTLAFGVIFGVSSFASTARANTHELYFHQAGALLAYSDAQVKILNAVITSKVFDPELAKVCVKELEQSLVNGKRAIDRVTTHLPEKLAKNEPELVKLRDKLKNAEDQLQKLATDIEEQTGKKAAVEEEVDPLEEAAAPPATDWDLLKAGVGWLGADVSAARSGYAKMARKLRIKPVRSPKRPRGKRGN